MVGYRAVAAAEQSGSAVVVASAARHLEDAMTHHGQAPAAVVFAAATARRLQDGLLERCPDVLLVRATLVSITSCASVYQ
ncbi:hypothetical protein ACFP1Z_30870 [Streptomyces gamaensis]|uniref:Uncharacterized protein n=1 Tax=Streptomyces gamaensis TaxID=1763542 RepID=A0ABW0Z6W7_9ACTN